MSSGRSESDSMNSDTENSEYLDPRIQVELERLNTCTDEINKLETELDEANTTFRMLLNESMRRLKVLTCKLGSCIDRARPYYEAVDIAKKAQAECQRAAVKFQRANEIHQAAKETVALAETRFLSNQHEWQFDSAWQEMLNHAIIKVTEAEHQRTESGQEHQKRATLFNVAEQRVATLEQKLKRTIIKSRPYFEEKALCQEQLDTQKKRVEELQTMISKVKSDYSGSLKRLEAISEEIHQRRRNKSGSGSPVPRGPREPGVGAEIDPKLHEEIKPPPSITYSPDLKKRGSSSRWSRDDLENELDKFEVGSIGSISVHTSSHVSESEDYDDEDLDELRQKVKELSMAEVRSDTWETELAESILRLDNAMLERECNRELRAIASKPCGSPLREQECNRELTAIVTSKPEDDLNAETVTNGSGEGICNVETQKCSESLDINGTGNIVSKQNSDIEPPKLPDSTNTEVVNKADLKLEFETPSCSKTLDTVLAEEENKRLENTVSNSSSFVTIPLLSPRSPITTPQIEQLSAVALNQLVNEKEAIINNNIPSKSLFHTLLNMKSLDLDSKQLDYNDQSVNDVDSSVDKNVAALLDSSVKNKLNMQNSENLNGITQNGSERRQSIGAAASKLLNSTKMESLRANLNENILNTIKDVSENVLNRLVRQDSNTIKTEQIPNSQSCQSNPFEINSNDDELSSSLNNTNNQPSSEATVLNFVPSDSVVHLQANTSIVQPQQDILKVVVKPQTNGSIFQQFQSNFLNLNSQTVTPDNKKSSDIKERVSEQ